MQRIILRELMHRPVCSVDELLDEVYYHDGGPTWPRSCLRVTIGTLRPKLREGFKIVNHYGSYSLVQPENPDVPPPDFPKDKYGKTHTERLCR